MSRFSPSRHPLLSGQFSSSQSGRLAAIVPGRSAIALAHLGLSIGLIAGLTACSKQPASTLDQPPARVLTTFSVIAEMAQNVAGDRMVVQSLTKPGTEVHTYQPTPSDLLRAQQAELILDNGLGLEKWADRFYTTLPKVKRVTLSQGLSPIMIEGATTQPNPHAWMSPKNAQRYVVAIQTALSQMDPSNAAIYQANAQAYNSKIQTLDTKLRQSIAQLSVSQRVLVTCEGAFSYLTRDYGLQEAYLWPVNAEQQGSPQQLEKVIGLVKAQKIPAVFCESTVNDRPQQQVAKETGAKLAGTLYVDSLSPPDGPAATYLQLLEHNIDTILKGLKTKSP
jgi:manganese transport system substrate-binding protein